MTSNPYYNAGIALLYIILVVSVITLGSQMSGPDSPDNYLMPVGMLSLLVVSAAFMAYNFFYQPVMMLLDGKRKEAVSLFWRTVATFAASTLVILVVAMMMVR